jgi:hypothetical protein
VVLVDVPTVFIVADVLTVVAIAVEVIIAADVVGRPSMKAKVPWKEISSNECQKRIRVLKCVKK